MDGLTIGETPFFIITGAIKCHFTFGADKVLNMPLFSQSINNSFFVYWLMTATTNGYIHFIVTTKAV